MKKEELIKKLEDLNIDFDSSLKKEELLKLLKVEEEYFSIKVLKNVYLPKNMEEYSEELGSIEYLPNDLIKKVNIKYLNRFKIFPNHIKIIK